MTLFDRLERIETGEEPAFQEVLDVNEELSEMLGSLKESPHNQIRHQRIIDIYSGERHVVTLYLGNKYAQFYYEFAQIGRGFEELKPLFDYLERNEFDMNLD